MSKDAWQEAWDEELRLLFREVEAGFSSENQRARSEEDCEEDLGRIQRANRQGLDRLATVDPKNLDRRHQAKYSEAVRQHLWISLLSEAVVTRRIRELVEKSGRVLTPEEVYAAVLRLLGVRAKPKAKE